MTLCRTTSTIIVKAPTNRFEFLFCLFSFFFVSLLQLTRTGGPTKQTILVRLSLFICKAYTTDTIAIMSSDEKSSSSKCALCDKPSTSRCAACRSRAYCSK
jgi:hypothetical protein